MLARPATYTRQSSARANKSEASPATQREATMDRAVRDHPGAAVLTFEDLGRSGFDPDVLREDYDRLVSAIRAGEITHLYVYYVSRLTRKDPKVALAEWLPLLAGGLTIISITEGTFGPDNTMDLIHLLLRMDAAHNESKTKSAAVRGAKALAYAAGGHVGAAPYGFGTVERIQRTPDGAPVAIRALMVAPAEARTLRVASRAVRRGHAVHAVCRYLERRGVPTRGATVGKVRAGSAWSDRALTMRLRDPRIAGMPAVAVTDAKGNTIGYHVATGVPGERVLPAPAEAIISPGEFWALQGALNGRTRAPYHQGDAPALLSSLGLLYCECGKPMKSRRFLAPELATRNAYQCTAAAGQHACTVSMATLDAYVRMRIDARLRSLDAGEPDEDTLEILAEATRRYGAATVAPETAAQRTALTAELAEATDALSRQADALGAATGAAAGALTAAVTATGARVDALTSQLAELDAALDAALPIDLWLSSDYGDEESWWGRASVPERRDFVRLWLDRITVRRAAAKGGRPTQVDPWGAVRARVVLEWAGSRADVQCPTRIAGPSPCASPSAALADSAPKA